MRIAFSKVAEADAIIAARRLKDVYGNDLGRFRFQEMMIAIDALTRPPATDLAFGQDEFGLPIFAKDMGMHRVVYQRYQTHIWILGVQLIEDG